MTLNSRGVLMRLNFLIEAGKFRHSGVFQVLTQEGQLVPEDRVLESLPVYFSSLEASGLSPRGQSADAKIEPDRWWGLSVSESIVFRYMRRLHDRFNEKKKIVLLSGKDQKSRTLLRLIDFNSLETYSIAEVKGFS